MGPVVSAEPLNIHWDTEDPFIFASHHRDDYPKGNAQQAPPLDEIRGRNLGRDYQVHFGFRMYNGKVVPGFPLHSHWGYETVSLPMTGYVDFFDSLGNQGRYGFGDAQWIMAGGKYQHCEMYPLASSEERNPHDMTQIMINLPKERKACGTGFGMVWSESSVCVETDGCSVLVITGSFGGVTAVSPNKDSWAANPENNVRILRIRMDPGASFTLNPVSETISRNLYMTEGSSVSFGYDPFNCPRRFKLRGNETVTFTNGDSEGIYWLLEGEPIGEKQSSFGPVTLGSDREVKDALNTIRKTELQDWPWNIVDKTQPKGTERFVKHADGREERPRWAQCYLNPHQ